MDLFEQDAVRAQNKQLQSELQRLKRQAARFEASGPTIKAGDEEGYELPIDEDVWEEFLDERSEFALELDPESSEDEDEPGLVEMPNLTSEMLKLIGAYVKGTLNLHEQREETLLTLWQTAMYIGSKKLQTAVEKEFVNRIMNETLTTTFFTSIQANILLDRLWRARQTLGLRNAAAYLATEKAILKLVKDPNKIWQKRAEEHKKFQSTFSFGIQVSAAYSHSLVLMKSGDVYSFGYLDYQLFNPYLDPILPKRIAVQEKVVQVSAGLGYTLLLTARGEVYSYGMGTAGNLGHGDKSRLTASPKLIAALKGTKVREISAGAGHSLVLADSGEVYSFGWGRYGQLGHGDTEEQTLPKRIVALKGVVQVSAGASHSLVLTDSGAVYSFGAGENGQLGHGDTVAQTLPKHIELEKRIVQVSAGEMHSLLLTDSGAVYSFGAGDEGQLGHGDQDDQTLPKRIELEKRVVQVSAGGSHSLVLTDSGAVYSFGSADNGQLGQGDEETQTRPKLIESTRFDLGGPASAPAPAKGGRPSLDKRVAQVSAGNAHSLLRTDSGEVYSFGKGYHETLGHGDAENQTLPKLVGALQHVVVVETLQHAAGPPRRRYRSTHAAFGERAPKASLYTREYARGERAIYVEAEKHLRRSYNRVTFCTIQRRYASTHVLDTGAGYRYDITVDGELVRDVHPRELRPVTF